MKTIWRAQEFPGLCFPVTLAQDSRLQDNGVTESYLPPFLALGCPAGHFIRLSLNAEDEILAHELAHCFLNEEDPRRTLVLGFDEADDPKTLRKIQELLPQILADLKKIIH
ncbi:MAG: hypothetical protein FJ015_07520 [Chloroflexi bacterium]|nr:hypothetical protein [Chloroflexota bacterium]